MPVLPSYRNQAIDLPCNLVDWFLNEGNTVFNELKEDKVGCGWMSNLYLEDLFENWEELRTPLF